MPCPAHLACYLQRKLGLRADNDWAAFLAALVVGMALAVLGLA
jgi:hypothetical protein